MYRRLYHTSIRNAAMWPRSSKVHQIFMANAREYLRRIHERR